MTLLLVTLLLKSLLVFAAAGLLLLILRRSSAAARHLICLLTLGAVLLLPLASLSLPGWHLPVLATRQDVEPTSVQRWLPGGQAPVLPVRKGEELKRLAAGAASLHGTGSSSNADALPAASSSSSLTGRTPAKQGGEFLLYLLGLLLASARPLLGLWGIRRLSHECAAIADAPTLSAAADCAGLLGLQTPRVCRADVPVPMTWGWRRPVIVLPPASADWPEDRLRSVLLHEMAHVRRRDWPGHRVADFACALLWFHPLVWLTARRLRAESELACDDLVLASGISAPDYARHLLEIASALPRVPGRSSAAIAMAQTSHIESRLTMILDKTRTRRTVARRVLLTALIPGTAALVTLAVLRPDAKAQTAPARSATKPSIEVTVPNGSVLSGPSIAITRGARGSFLTVSSAAGGKVLPDLTINGTTLFAGMTDANRPGSPWWSASGAVLSTPVYDTNAYHAENHASPDQHTVSFAFRLPADAVGTTVRYELPHSMQSSSDGFWPTKIAENAQRTEAQMFSQTNGTRIVTAAYPVSLTKTSLRVGVASGAWTTSVHYLPPNHDAGSSSTSPDGTFIFSPLTQTQDGFSLTLTTDTMGAYGQKWDLRIVAVDASGHEALPTLIGDNSSGKMDQINVHFALPSAQVKDIRVEIRPFQWIEFKDVALKPVQ